MTIAHLTKRLFYVLPPNVVDSPANRLYTMAKSSTLNVKGNIVSNNDEALTFSKSTNISPKLEFGFNRAFDSLINPSRISLYSSFSVSVFGEYQSLKTYDTIAKTFTLENTRRVSPGIHPYL